MTVHDGRRAIAVLGSREGTQGSLFGARPGFLLPALLAAGTSLDSDFEARLLLMHVAARLPNVTRRPLYSERTKPSPISS